VPKVSAYRLNALRTSLTAGGRTRLKYLKSNLRVLATPRPSLRCQREKTRRAYRTAAHMTRAINIQHTRQAHGASASISAFSMRCGLPRTQRRLQHIAL